MKSVLSAAAAVSIAAGAFAAQAPPEPQRREVQAIRVSSPPSIDGDLTDAAWTAAPEITGFTQRDPDEGTAESEKTIVKVVYDEEAVYVSARLEDSGTVTTQLGRRDSSDLRSDYFCTYLDPHFDRRSGAGFCVNPSNVQFDTILYNDSWEDQKWDGVWPSAAKLTEGGWQVEMKIPFSQLRFPDLPAHTWGVNFVREISRRNEHSRLVHTPKNESGFVSRFASLTGIEGIRPKRMLEIVPYAVSRADLSTRVAPGDPLNSDSEYRVDAGVDVKYGLTSNLTLTGTINPDFGQVEVDPAQLNLSQFELFFPEKRPFFIEGSNLFDFGRGGSNHNFTFNLSTPSFFYSRRIGRAPQGIGAVPYDYIDAPGESTILAAAKITGKTSNGWSIGVLDALTDEETARIVTLNPNGRNVSSQQTVEPMTNYLVARTTKDLGNKGRVGALFTAVHRDLSSELSFLRQNAYTGGVDGYWAFGNRDVILEWFAGGTLVEGSAEAIRLTQIAPARYFQRPDASHVELDPGRTSLSGYGGRVTLARQTGKWKYNVQAQTYSPGFESSDLGFNTRSDATATHAVLLYNNPDRGKYTRNRNFWVGKFQNWNTAGDRIADGFRSSGSMEFNNYWYSFWFAGLSLNRYDDRKTRGGPLVEELRGIDGGGGFGSDSRKKVSFEAHQQNSRRQDGSYDHSGGFSLRYRPSSNVSFRFNPYFARSKGNSQYVRTVADEFADRTYDRRYVFAEIEQRTLELATRIDWTFTSRLTLQLFVQPFIASGDYHSFKELHRPKTSIYSEYGTDRGTIVYDPAENRYTIDPDGAGPSKSFAIRNPDFNLRSVRGSAVVRWEFRPGSLFYFVWNENRQDVVPIGDFRASRDLSGIGDAGSDDVFLIKLSYWFGA